MLRRAAAFCYPIFSPIYTSSCISTLYRMYVRQLPIAIAC